MVHRLDITRLTDIAAVPPLVLTAGAPLAPASPRRRWQPYAWPAALLLHALAIGLLLLLLRHRVPQEALEPTGVSVVYEPGAATSQTPHQAPLPTPAETPAPPPAPAQTAAAQPDVNLNLPDNALAPPLPSSPAQHAAPAPRHVRAARPTQKYLVMNNMSLGQGRPSVPAPNGQGLNLSLPQSDAEAANTPEITIEGQVGADWEAGFNKWVYAHLYYPDAAAAQGQQGYVTVQFTAHRDGSVTGLHMLESSGSPFLDQGWTGIFAQNQLPPFPPGGSDTLKITARVHYMLVP